MIQPFKVTVMEPYALAINAPKPLVPHPNTLKGKVVGVLWNSKAEGDIVLQQICKILTEEYGVKETRFFKKKSASGPAKPQQLDDLAKQAEVFVTGVGD